MYSVSLLNETIETGVVMEMLRHGYSSENMHTSLFPWVSVTNAQYLRCTLYSVYMH